MTKELALEVLEIERRDAVLILRLNRPEALNAFSQALLWALADAVRDAALDPRVRVLVVTGAGRAFCAGGDMREGRGAARKVAQVEGWGEDPMFWGIEQNYDRLSRQAETALQLFTMPKPTIAMVRGPARGAGFSLAAACDLRICSETASFATAYGNIGFSGDFGGTYFLTHLLGAAKARELFLLGDTLNAKAALACGFATRVVQDADLEAETLKIAERLAAGPPLAYRYMKRNLNLALHATMAETLDAETLAMARTAQSADLMESIAAMQEKRKPVFRGG
jgi:2-(1,2-epoxy-1,2-dihydrophenyl)acetyl-CoA isomerase